MSLGPVLRRRGRAAAVGLLLVAGAVKAQETSDAHPATGTEPEVRLELRVRPIVDLYQRVRALAEGDEAPPELLGPAVEAARALGAKLGSPLSWGVLDGALGEVDDLETLAEIFGRLPGALRGPGGSVDVRAEAAAFVAALRAAEPAFQQTLWPDDARTVEALRADLQARLRPREAALFADLLSSLGFHDPGRPIPVELVALAPWPGAVTFRAAEGPVIFVGANAAEGDTLLEIVLHESTHALSVLDDGGQDVLSQVAGALVAAGLSPRDRRVHDVVHGIQFVQAAETVRRLVDPEHVPYGESAGLYDRLPFARELVVPVWTAHLDGELTREEAIAKLVAGVMGGEDGTGAAGPAGSDGAGGPAGPGPGGARPPGGGGLPGADDRPDERGAGGA